MAGKNNKNAKNKQTVQQKNPPFPQKRKAPNQKKKKTFLGRCQKLLNSMLELEDSKPFRSAVDKTKYPDYHTIVRYDIDLAKISTKLHTGQYTDPIQFGDDVRLLVQNWREYLDHLNDASLPVLGQITKLSWWFESEYNKIMDAWKAHQVKKRRIEAQDESAEASVNMSKTNTPRIPPLVISASLGTASFSLPTPPHLLKQPRISNVPTTKTYASLFSSLTPGIVSTAAVTSSSTTVTSSDLRSTLSNRGISQPTNSLTGSRPRAFAPNLNPNSSRWAHNKPVSPNVRAVVNRRETFPGTQVRPNSAGLGRGKSLVNSSPRVMSKTLGQGSATKIRQKNPTSALTKTQGQKKGTPVLEVVIGASAVWFGEYKSNPSKDVRFTDVGIDFSIEQNNKVEEFHLDVNDLVRCCGHLRSVKSPRKNFFLFLTPAATKRLKTWLQKFTQTPGESCSLIVVFGQNVTVETCSRLMYIFWIFGRQSIFGSIFSEVGTEALSLLSNIHPGLTAQIETLTCDTPTKDQSETRASPCLATQPAAFIARMRQVRQAARNSQQANALSSTNSATRLTTGGAGNLGQTNDPTSRQAKSSANQQNSRPTNGAQVSRQCQLNTARGHTPSTSRPPFINLNQNKPEQSAARNARTKPQQSDNLIGRDNFAIRLENHIRTRLDSSSDNEQQQQQQQPQQQQPQRPASQRSDGATSEAERPAPRSVNRGVTPLEDLRFPENFYPSGPRMVQRNPRGQSFRGFSMGRSPFTGTPQYRPIQNDSRNGPVYAPHVNFWAQDANFSPGYDRSPWEQSHDPCLNDTDISGEAPDYSLDNGEMSFDVRTINGNNQSQFSIRVQNPEPNRMNNQFRGSGRLSKRGRRLLHQRHVKRFGQPPFEQEGQYQQAPYSDHGSDHYDDQCSEQFDNHRPSPYDDHASGQYNDQGSEDYGNQDPGEYNDQGAQPYHNHGSELYDNQTPGDGDNQGSGQHDIHNGNYDHRQIETSGSGQSYANCTLNEHPQSAPGDTALDGFPAAGQLGETSGDQAVEITDEELIALCPDVNGSEDTCVVNDTHVSQSQEPHTSGSRPVANQTHSEEINGNDSIIETDAEAVPVIVPATNPATIPVTNLAIVPMTVPDQNNTGPVELPSTCSQDYPSVSSDDLSGQARAVEALLQAECSATDNAAKSPSVPVLVDDDLEIIIPSDSEEELTFVPMSSSSAKYQPFLSLKTGEEESEDLVMTATKVSTKCPVTQQTMYRPLKNKHCGHCYDQDGINQLILNRKGKARCPVPGCSNSHPLLMMDMQFDVQLFKFIRQHTTDTKTLEELAKVAIELKLD